MFNRGFLEGQDIIPFFLNQDANNDIEGDWISLENYDRLYIYLPKPSGTAGDDLSIALNQATTNSGGGSKALTFTRLWHRVGAHATTPTWTEVTLDTASADLDLVSVNGADLATDTSVSQILVEVMASSLDVSNGFKFVQLTIEGDDIGNALVVSAFAILQGCRYPQAVPVDPTA